MESMPIASDRSSFNPQNTPINRDARNNRTDCAQHNILHPTRVTTASLTLWIFKEGKDQLGNKERKNTAANRKGKTKGIQTSAFVVILGDLRREGCIGKVNSREEGVKYDTYDHVIPKENHLIGARH